MNIKNRCIPSVIFLDLDGTLVEFCIEYLEARSEALRFLERYALPQDLKFTLNDSIFAMDREVRIFLSSRSKLETTYKEIHEELVAILEKYELRAAERTKLLPRVRETLEELTRMGLRLVLFTADGDRSTTITLKRTGIAGFFELLASRGSSVEVKPHPHHLTSAMERVGVKPEEAIVVGDSVADIISGKCVRATTVGVTTGLGSKEELIEIGADYILESVAGLPALIRQLHAQSAVGQPCASGKLPSGGSTCCVQTDNSSTHMARLFCDILLNAFFFDSLYG
jgi:HAD superfamily hydrolase (TIGR01509 family)